MEKREIHFFVNGEALVAYSERDRAKLSVREVLDMAGFQPPDEFCLVREVCKDAGGDNRLCNPAEVLEIAQHERFAAVPREEKVIVEVHYIAASKPFERGFSKSATVALVKSEAMTAFGLAEGSNASGDTVLYTLYDQKKPLENPHETVGALAGHACELRLKLVQQITQG